jgi:hypothetical protein
MMYFVLVPLLVLLVVVLALSFKARSRKLTDGQSRLDEARKL